MISSTTFSIAPSVGDLLHAARFDERARIAALAPDDLEQVLGDLAGDRALADQVDDRAELRGDTGEPMSLAFLVERPNSSLMTQLAASLPSRPLATHSKKSALSRSATSTPAS
jgi:hypothetical protein